MVFLTRAKKQFSLHPFPRWHPAYQGYSINYTKDHLRPFLLEVELGTGGQEFKPRKTPPVCSSTAFTFFPPQIVSRRDNSNWESNNRASKRSEKRGGGNERNRPLNSPKKQYKARVPCSKPSKDLPGES